MTARFLDRLASASLSRSALQRAVGLNYDLFRKYLDALVARGLVAETANGFVLTEEGHHVRRELVAWLETLFGGRL